MVDIFQTAPNGCPCDFILVNNLSALPAEPPRPIGDYEFQFVQLPLRTLLPDAGYFNLPYADLDAHIRFFEDAKKRLSLYLEVALRWNRDHQILTFVSNFLVPQQNAFGRLLRRYDIRNPVYLVEQINIALAEELERFANTILVDADQIASTLGKAFVQDDSVEILSHNSGLLEVTMGNDRDRLQWLPPLTDIFEVKFQSFARALWIEMAAMVRTIKQLDQVKLVAVDLDDTLWRGVAAENIATSSNMEGWPLGVVEALHFLKRRGVLLAIVSRNDEARIVELWDEIMLGRLSLDDFAIRRINWRPKVDNLVEIIQELNLLPGGVVFIDDNPVERAAIEEALPGVRTLGANPYLVRRILLWAPEMQVATITEESSKRTEMVQAQVGRESDRRHTSRKEFLSTLKLRVGLARMKGIEDARFTRAFELINKTNQFNTTGRRWSREDCITALAGGAQFFYFNVSDRYTNYGLVGVVIVHDLRIEQFVMSCRIFGLDVEMAVISELARSLAGTADISFALHTTDANLPAREFVARCGVLDDGGEWILPRNRLVERPGHIAVN